MEAKEAGEQPGSINLRMSTEKKNVLEGNPSGGRVEKTPIIDESGKLQRSPARDEFPIHAFCSISSIEKSFI